MRDIIETLKKSAAQSVRNKQRITAAIAELEQIEYIDIHTAAPIPPPPEPTPAAPDPGPGWRLVNVGEIIPKDAQYLDGSGNWSASVCGGDKCDGSLVFRTPIYHNPANLQSAGEGYRFCLVSETEEPGVTEWWNDEAKLWRVGSQGGGMHLHNKLTYRTKKPLPTT